MPNHCLNTLSISASNPSYIDSFIDKIVRAFEKYGSYSRGGDKFTFAAFVPPTENVLNGSSGHASFVRQRGVWERTTLTAEQAEEQGLEYYRGEYGTDGRGVVYTKLEMEYLGLVDWYNWNIANWGTKWDAYDVQLDRQDDNYLAIHFSSAWSPPEPVVHAMQEQHPELAISMEFDESGMMFRGSIETDGSVYTEEYDESELEEV